MRCASVCLCFCLAVAVGCAGALVSCATENPNAPDERETTNFIKFMQYVAADSQPSSLPSTQP